jgi:Holliday junction DNA helicase RuvB
VVEPYLLKVGFVVRTASGRKVTPLAYEHLGITVPADASQPRLL